jgi:malate dehydrogenase (oxaloacetate-decarboxylating)(NADP+)
MDSGVATRPITDFDAYRAKLAAFVFRSGQIMQPLFEQARLDPKRVVYAEGEDPRILRAVQMAVDDGLATPIVIGRRAVIEDRIKELGLRIELGGNVELLDPQTDSRHEDYAATYHELNVRRGVTPGRALELVRNNATIMGAVMVKRGEADALICGTHGQYEKDLVDLIQIIGKSETVEDISALSLVVLPQGSYFLCDTHVKVDPSATQIAGMVRLAAQEVRRFGIEPKVALLSHSNFGTRNSESARKMRKAVAILHENDPDLEVEGEMHADAAVNAKIRERVFPNSRLSGNANLLVAPSLDAANIAFNLLKTVGEGLSVGPMLLGMAAPVHIVTQSVSTRGVVNMTAYAVVDAQGR